MSGAFKSFAKQVRSFVLCECFFCNGSSCKFCFEIVVFGCHLHSYHVVIKKHVCCYISQILPVLDTCVFCTVHDHSVVTYAVYSLNGINVFLSNLSIHRLKWDKTWVIVSRSDHGSAPCGRRPWATNQFYGWVVTCNFTACVVKMWSRVSMFVGDGWLHCIGFVDFVWTQMQKAYWYILL